MTTPVKSELLRPGLSRRGFLANAALRGVGAAVALPALASLRTAGAAEGAAAPSRMAFVYVPNGVHVDRWRPVGTRSGPRSNHSPTCRIISRS